MTDKQHAELGASNAERWMACPGSVRMTQGLPNSESEYAREGTAAHALAARCLLVDDTPHAFIGDSFEGVVVTEEMADAVQEYVDEVHAIVAREPDATLWIERKFSLERMNPPAPMFGYADAVILLRNRLVVPDYKHGAGVVKEAVGNPQPRYYALGALLWIEKELPHLSDKIKEVEVVIVQPRAPHEEGSIRREVITRAALYDFADKLMAAAHATHEDDAPLHAGEHCRFCPAAGVCPELRNRAQLVAQSEFADLPADVPPDPRLLPVDALAHILDNADILEDWLRAVRATAQGKLEAGEEVPGWKLVPKRAYRRWIDEEAVEDFVDGLDRNILMSSDDLYDRKMKSPAQVEKLLKRVKVQLPDHLVDKSSSGYTIAPESDRRPAVSLDPASEFAALPPADSAS